MSWSKTYGGSQPQRVNKWLAQEGVCSRREAEALIADGLVSIDGARVEDVGRKIEPGQTLTLADKAQQQLQSAIGVVINKPVGLVSAHPEAGQVPAARLLTRENLWLPAQALPSTSSEKRLDTPRNSFQRLPEPIEGSAVQIPNKNASLPPLGRLDQDSRGLLLLSDDGVLAKALIGPESKLDKEYVVRVTGAVNDKKLALLRHGLELDGRQLKPAKVSVIAQQTLRFILLEGRNRQIRRMCEAVDLDVADLRRVRIGPLELGDLPEGKWRPLTREERAALLAKA